MARMAYDKITVVDVESTCWNEHPPKNQFSQIIEIGICLLDIKTLKVSNKKSILIKPNCSKVSEFCTELTTLTQEMLDRKGVSFKTACKILVDDFNSKKRVWASWGDYDRKMFETGCNQQGISYPFGKRHINAKVLFTLKHKLNKEPGMARALKMLDIPLEGTHHRGDDDAWNIAKLLGTCLD